MSAEFAVQSGLYAALSGDSEVADLAAAIYDFAPQDAAWPYIEIGTVLFSEMDTKATVGFDFVARVHTRSRSGAVKETKDIQGAIYGALHLQGLTVAGYRTILLRRELSEVMRAPDGSFHGVCEYRGLIEE